MGGNPHVRLYDINSSSGNPVTSFDGHTNNVTAVGFQKDRKWMYTGSEDGTVKIWDIRAPGYQRDYRSNSPITTVVLHPNQGEIICGDEGRWVRCITVSRNIISPSLSLCFTLSTHTRFSADGNIRVWDLTANSCSYELVPDGKTAIRSTSVASDASLVVAANNRGTCFVWKLSTSARLRLRLLKLFLPGVTPLRSFLP